MVFFIRVGPRFVLKGSAIWADSTQWDKAVPFTFFLILALLSLLP